MTTRKTLMTIWQWQYMTMSVGIGMPPLCLHSAFALPSLLRWRQSVSRTEWYSPQPHLSVCRMNLKSLLEFWCGEKTTVTKEPTHSYKETSINWYRMKLKWKLKGLRKSSGLTSKRTKHFATMLYTYLLSILTSFLDESPPDFLNLFYSLS